MNKQKLTYLSPETETLVVRFEGVICQSVLSDTVDITDWQEGTDFPVEF